MQDFRCPNHSDFFIGLELDAGILTNRNWVFYATLIYARSVISQGKKLQIMRKISLIMQVMQKIALFMCSL